MKMKNKLQFSFIDKTVKYDKVSNHKHQVKVGVASISHKNMSRGVLENQQLKSRLESQLSRLLDQLEDVEKNKDSLDEDEYSELKEETLEQVANKIVLVDDLKSSFS